VLLGPNSETFSTTPKIFENSTNIFQQFEYFKLPSKKS
jgi:hypothetical protein